MTMTLKQLRAGTDYTQADVAKIIGVNLAVYNAWEVLSENDVKKLADLFKVDPKSIVIPKPLNQNERR